MPQTALNYFSKDASIRTPTRSTWLASRLAFPVLMLLSREQSLRLGLTPIDDERVIMALRNATGRALDIGCGANNFIRSYGNGVGVDVVNWDGVDLVVEDAARLPFKTGEFDTTAFLACLNHISNRGAAATEAYRVTTPGGRVLVTMITPRLGAFIHWLRFRNDPDHQARCIDHSHEFMGMSAGQVREILTRAGFTDIKRKRFVFGLNSLYLGRKPAS